MASKALVLTTFLLCLNLVFFTMVNSTTYVPCPPPPSKSPGHHDTPSTPKTPVVVPSKGNKCPINTLKLGVCANLLGDLIHAIIGTPSKTPCCPLIKGLTNLEAAICLCTALKANVLGMDLNVPLSMSLLLNYCGKGVPYGFQCA